MNVLTANIEFATKLKKKYKITFPFKAVIQTSSLNIEKHCKSNWPDLMRDTAYNMDQLARLQKMKAYIKRSFSNSDWQDILKHFQVKGWFNPITDFNSVLVSGIVITDSTCKFWSDPVHPYLTIYGQITVDLEKVINFYISKKHLIVKKHSDSMTKQIAQVYYVTNLPSILIYDGIMNYNTEIMEIIKEHFKKQGELTKQLEKELKIKELSKAKKDFQWIGNSIHITVSDWQHLLKKNALPITLGALYLLKKDKQKKQAAILQQQVNIYSAMLNLLEGRN